MVTETKTREKPRAAFRGEPMDDTTEFGLLMNDEAGQQVIDAVNGRYKGTHAELQVSSRGQRVAYSQLYRHFAIDEALRDFGVRVAYPHEAQKLLRNGKMPLRNETYQDLAGVFDFSGVNHELAIRLYNTITHQGDFDKIPHLLTGLALDRESDTNELSFRLTGYSRAIPAEILLKVAKDGGSQLFDKDDEQLLVTGLPSKVGEGNRRIYVAQQKKPLLDNLGFRRFYVDGSEDLNAGLSDLLDANEDARVVWVRDAVTRADFSAQADNLAKARDKGIENIRSYSDKAIKGINEKYQEAVRGLAG